MMSVIILRSWYKTQLHIFFLVSSKLWNNKKKKIIVSFHGWNQKFTSSIYKKLHKF